MGSKSMKGAGAPFSDIEARQVVKVGRNAPCPCDSGKKYKDCHEKDGSVFLDKLARDADEKRARALRQKLKLQGVPWYKRLLTRAQPPR